MPNRKASSQKYLLQTIIVIICTNFCLLILCQKEATLDHRTIEEFIIDGKSSDNGPSRSKYDYGVYSESGDWTRNRLNPNQRISRVSNNFQQSSTKPDEIRDEPTIIQFGNNSIIHSSIKEPSGASADKLQQQPHIKNGPRSTSKDFETTVSALSQENYLDGEKSATVNKDSGNIAAGKLIEAKSNVVFRENKPHKRAVYRGRYYLDQHQRDYDKQRLHYSRLHPKRHLPFYEYRYLTRYNYEDPINYQLRQQLKSLGSNFWLDRYHYNWYRHRQPNYYLNSPSTWPRWIENQQALSLAPPLNANPSFKVNDVGHNNDNFAALPPLSNVVPNYKLISSSNHQRLDKNSRETIDARSHYNSVQHAARQPADLPHINSVVNSNDYHNEEKQQYNRISNEDFSHQRDNDNNNIHQLIKTPNSHRIFNYPAASGVQSGEGNKALTSVQDTIAKYNNTDKHVETLDGNEMNKNSLDSSLERGSPKEMNPRDSLSVSPHPESVNYQAFRRLDGESFSEYSNRIERLNNYYRWIRNRSTLSPSDLAALDYSPGKSSSFRLGNSDLGIGPGSNPTSSRQVWLDNESPTIAASLSTFADAPYNSDYNPYDARYPPNDLYGLLPRDYWPHHGKSFEFNHRSSAYSNSNRGYSESLSSNLTDTLGGSPSISAYEKYLRCKDMIPRSRLWYLYNC